MYIHVGYLDEIGQHSLTIDLRKNHLRILQQMLSDFDQRKAALISAKDNVDMDSLFGEGMELYEKFKHLYEKLINGRTNIETGTGTDGPVARREQAGLAGKRKSKASRSVSIHTHAGRHDKKSRGNTRQARKARS